MFFGSTPVLADSTAAFISINGPLRDLERQRRGEPHPLPLTVALLSTAVGKLRAVGAEGPGSNEAMDLYRGMRGVDAAEEFLERGGTELAPMSTTSSVAVAIHYARGGGSGGGAASSGTSLLFRIRTRSSMERGAEISFLSAFPAEAEYLYPPLLYLQPSARGTAVTVTLGGQSYKVIEVEPRL